MKLKYTPLLAGARQSYGLLPWRSLFPSLLTHMKVKATGRLQRIAAIIPVVVFMAAFSLFSTQANAQSCPCEGGMIAMTVEYVGTATNANIMVYDDNTLVKTFTGVNPGDTLTITAQGDFGDDELPNKTKWALNGGTRHETHASCSQVIINLTFGPVKVIGHIDEKNGDLCGYVPPGVVPPPCPCEKGIDCHDS